MNINIELNIQVESELESLISASEWEGWFEVWLNDLHPSFSPIQSYAVGLCLTQDHQIQHFNATFRHQDKATDVLAFASLENEALPAEILESHPLELGDIVISTETAQRQAADHHHSFKQELAWLASHGLLHLLGWDHPNDQALENMLNQQRRLLELIKLL